MAKLTLINNLLRREGNTLILANGEEGCCCGEPECPCTQYITEQSFSFSENTGNGICQCASAQIYGQQTVTVPTGVSVPRRVVIFGAVNDDFVLDGQVIQENTPEWIYGGCCNGAHEFCYSFTLQSRTFTIAVRDNHGSGTSYNVTIRYCGVADGPSGPSGPQTGF